MKENILRSLLEVDEQMSNSLFFKPRSIQLAKIIRITSIPEAKNSIHQLDLMFAKGDRKRRVQILRATVLASNRAIVMAENPRNSQLVRNIKAKVAEMYHFAAEGYSEQLAQGVG